MRRFISGLFLALSVMTMATGVVQAQLNGNPFSEYYKQTFGTVYNIKEGQSLKDTLPTTIGKIIAIALSFIGVILLVLMVYAGFLWLTAGGNEDQVGHAKKLIKNGVIGMAIALSAFVLTNFVVDQLNGALGTTPQGQGNQPSIDGPAK